MIVGIGTDLCDIRRIEKNISEYGDRFLDRIFTEHEQKYCNGKSGRAGYYAKRFAAKEAVAKALAGEMTGSLGWHDVEVRNDPSGRPTITLSGKALERVSDYEKYSVHVSLTDDYPYAQAFAIVEVMS